MPVPEKDWPDSPHREKRWPLSSRLPALQEWYGSAVGQRVWQCEKQLLDHHLPDLFGYHLMSLGICPSLPLADASPIHHRFTVCPSEKAEGISACSALHELPIGNESVDVAILHHSLDYSEDPHQLLRETARVLMPYGYVLILGIQRWSALGMQQALRSRLGDDAVASHDFISVTRVHDWLKLLDFNVIKSRHTVYVPPQLSGTLRNRLQWLERFGWGAQLPFGSVYFVLAQKIVKGVHPVVAPWETVGLRNRLSALTPRPVAPTSTVTTSPTTHTHRSRLH
jgi:SAM-dependent methyltransferase